MLERELVERLEVQATDGHDIYVDASILAELLCVYRAWLDAPRGKVIGQTADDYVSPPTGVIVATDNATAVKGKSIRLVRDGDSGEGETEIRKVAKRNLRSLIERGSDDKALMLKCLEELS